MPLLKGTKTDKVSSDYVNPGSPFIRILLLIACAMLEVILYDLI